MQRCTFIHAHTHNHKLPHWYAAGCLGFWKRSNHQDANNVNQVYCTFISQLPLTFTVWQLDALHFLIFLFMIHDVFLFTFPLVLFPFFGVKSYFGACVRVIVAIVLRGISRTDVLYLGGSGLFTLVDVSEIQLLFCHVASKSEECKCCCWFRAATDTLSACVLQ